MVLKPFRSGAKWFSLPLLKGKASMVFVIAKDGQPLMPTRRYRKVRIWLKEGQAKIVRRKPFTIQLLFETTVHVQNLVLGMDIGYETIGVSVRDENQEFFSSEVQLRTDVTEKITEKRMYRRNRRNRNTHYRKSRFINRRKRQTIAPTMEQKVHSHLALLDFVKKLLPIGKIIIESNSFDMHKMKNPDVEGIGYQQGTMYGYENVKAYILARDKYQCYFNDKCSKILHVHHVIFRSQGGSDAPDNLITLCEKHHKQVHKSKITLGSIKPKHLKSATAMNIVRNQILRRVPEAQITFGYITKGARLALGLSKSHATDAFIIAGGKTQKRCQVLNMFFKRKNNRTLQLNRKGFKPSVRQKRYTIQPYDIIRWNGQLYRAVGVQNLGTYLKITDGKNSIVKKLSQCQIVFHQKSLVVA
jgi:hypothetical protein